MTESGQGLDLTRFAAAAGTGYAADAAAELFRAGGNAADAAVAAAVAVSVTEPLMSSVGVGGFALVRGPDGAAEVVDYYDQMPGRGLPSSAFGGNPPVVTLKYGAGVRSIVGAGACSVPGALRGWESILRRHGRLTLREAVAPAVRFAREGFAMSPTSASWSEVSIETLGLTPEMRKNFLTPDGRPRRAGETTSYPELADTLEAVGEAGADLLYRGELGRRLSEYVLAEGGLITREDLAGYEAVVREPLTFAYGGNTIHTNGPPSAGGATLAQILGILAAGGESLDGMDRERYVVLFGGAMRLALQDRASAYVEIAQNREVAERLTSAGYAAEQRQRIAGTLSGTPWGNTTHLSCVDESGLAVSLTQSMGYGSGIVIPGTGIPMNNSLGEPELNPKGFHAAKPGERLVSSMSPTVVAGPDGDVISLGSSGASRIPTAIAQTLVNVLNLGMPLADAVAAPRFHAETTEQGDLLAYEVGARVGGVPAGHDAGGVLRYDEPSMFFGGVNAVRRARSGAFEAAADGRVPGT